LAKMKKAFAERLPTRRRLVQLYAALLYNAHAKGFISGEIYTGAAKFTCVPGLNCYSCPGAVGACPLGALQNALASSGSRAPFYIIGILLLYGLIFGRTVCGWLCPAGMLQELLHKLPTPKIRKSAATRRLSILKYIILGVFVIGIPLYYSLRRFPLPAFCKYICPAGTLEGAVGLLAHPANSGLWSMLGGLFTWKVVVLLAVIVLCIFAHRAFCRFLCPLGAIYGLFSRVAIIGVKLEKPKCVDCGKCVNCCPMDIHHVGDRECISCGKCINVCPTAAISLKAGGAVLAEKDPSPEKKAKLCRARTIAWIVTIAVLLGAFVLFNRPEKTAEAPPAPTPTATVTAPPEAESQPTPSLPVGSAPGLRAPDFTLPLYGGGRVSLGDYAGKTLVLNFWATWCSPCVAELPHFEELYREYGDEIAVLAVHSSLVTDDVEEFLSHYDYSIPYALDETGEMIASYGGSTMLPQTVIIDESGVVTYNAVGSLSYEELLELTGK